MAPMQERRHEVRRRLIGIVERTLLGAGMSVVLLLAERRLSRRQAGGPAGSGNDAGAAPR
jgi:hypothetical protein